MNKGNANNRCLNWFARIDGKEQCLVQQVCTDSSIAFDSIVQTLGGDAGLDDQQRGHILMLRGLLAFGLLLHCLQKRYDVDFGTTDRCRTLRLRFDTPANGAPHHHLPLP